VQLLVSRWIQADSHYRSAPAAVTMLGTDGPTAGAREGACLGGVSVMTTETARPRTEEFRITGDELLARVRELIHEGNIRRIIIRNEAGHTLIEIPMTVGVVGAALLPVWAAVGAIAALATDCTIVVERRD